MARNKRYMQKAIMVVDDGDGGDDKGSMMMTRWGMSVTTDDEVGHEGKN